ncbi:hypothetical protein V8D89_002776 [Ganoderma adspersum]
MPPSRAPRRKACQALLPDGATPCSATFRGWGRYCATHLDEHARLAGQYKDAAARVERLRRQGELADRQVRALANVSMADRALERVRAYLGALGDERRAREAYLRRFPGESASTFSASQSFARARAAVGSASASGSGGEGWSGGEGEGPGGAGREERSSSRGSRFTDDERHERRLGDLQEREAACAVLIERLQQRREEIVAAMPQRRGGRDTSQVDLEREPLLVAARRSRPSRWGWVGWAWRIVLLAILLGAIPLVISLTFLKRIGVSKVCPLGAHCMKNAVSTLTGYSDQSASI